MELRLFIRRFTTRFREIVLLFVQKVKIQSGIDFESNGVTYVFPNSIQESTKRNRYNF